MKEVVIPAWLARQLILIMERAYRRGYQHGIIAGEEGVKHNDPRISKWRTSIKPTSRPERMRGGTPVDPSELTVADRFMGLDGLLHAGYVARLPNGAVRIRRDGP